MSGAGGTAFHLDAAGTQNIVASGGGILSSVVVGTGASGATVTLRDGTVSGPVIAVVDASAQASLNFGVLLNSGLTAVVSGTPDVTVVIAPHPGYTT